MSDIRKILNIINEMTSGSVATVAMPLTTQRRTSESSKDNNAQDIKVIEYGNWENSTNTTSRKLKTIREKAAKLSRDIYGQQSKTTESMDGISQNTKQFTSETASKTRNPVAKAAQRVAKGSGKHKNPAKSIPRKAKHKSKVYEEDILEQDFIVSPTNKKKDDYELLDKNVGVEKAAKQFNKKKEQSIKKLTQKGTQHMFDSEKKAQSNKNKNEN